MGGLSKQVKEELLNALGGNQSGLFVFNGKLISIEVENLDQYGKDRPDLDLAQEIDEYPELKESLQRFLDHPEMKRYSAAELKERRSAKRK